jgi:hypothetical protein
MAKYKGKVNKDMTYIASIFAPKTPTVSGMPAVVSININNNCKIIVDNCAPYDVIIDRNDVLGFMDIETDELIPMKDSTKAIWIYFINTKNPSVQINATSALPHITNIKYT